MEPRCCFCGVPSFSGVLEVSVLSRSFHPIPQAQGDALRCKAAGPTGVQPDGETGLNPVTFQPLAGRGAPWYGRLKRSLLVSIRQIRGCASEANAPSRGGPLSAVTFQPVANAAMQPSNEHFVTFHNGLFGFSVAVLPGCGASMTVPSRLGRVHTDPARALPF